MGQGSEPGRQWRRGRLFRPWPRTALVLVLAVTGGLAALSCAGKKRRPGTWRFP